MKMKNGFVFLFLIIHSFCYSQDDKPNIEQNRTIDSLLACLKTDNEDTIKLIHLNKISREFNKVGSYDSALYFANSAIQLCSVMVRKVTTNKIIKSIQKGEADSYNNIGIINYYKGDYQEALKNYLVSLKLREQIGDKHGLADSYINIGYVFFDQSNYPEALKYYYSSLKIYAELSDKHGEADSYLNIGYVYYNQGNYPEALRNYFSSLKIYELIRNKLGIANSYNNIGILYDDQGNYSDALKYHKASLKIKKEIGDKHGIAASYLNIGIIYRVQGNFPEALKNYFASLKLFESIDSREGIASVYNNIGLIYFDQGYYNKALENFFTSLKIKVAMDDKVGIVSSYGNIGNVYLKQKKYKKAEEYLLKTKVLSEEIGYKEYLKNAYKDLTELYSIQGNFKRAFENNILFILYRDSIDNEETRKKTIQTQMTYEFEKKEAVATAEHKKELENQKAIADEKNRKQKVVIVFVVIGLILVLIFAVFIFRSLRITRKQKKTIEQQKMLVDEKNIQLNQQNEEISTQRDEIEAQRDEIEAQRDLVTMQKEEIEEIHNEVKASINYAKRIQEAVLPVSFEARSVLGEHFILFKPKDIVSGDFYWTTKINNWLIVAVADCTGHGVPGAFMSMLGISFLNEIVQKQEVKKANHILNMLRLEVINALQQKGASGEQKDGMDISLLVIDTNTNQAQWAGANNPLYIIKTPVGLSGVEDKGDGHTSTPLSVTDNFIELKGDKMPIAIYPEMKDFTNHEFVLSEGDCVYLFTDGYADQFGGPKGRKFMYKQFKERLIQNSNKPLAEQKEIFETVFDNWKSTCEQIDDVTLIGIKI